MESAKRSDTGPAGGVVHTTALCTSALRKGKRTTSTCKSKPLSKLLDVRWEAPGGMRQCGSAYNVSGYGDEDVMWKYDMSGN